MQSYKIIYLYHCKNERVVMTNFGHLSCTQCWCESLTKEWKNVPAHKLNHLSVERPLVHYSAYDLKCLLVDSCSSSI